MPSSFWSRQTSMSLVSGVPRWKPVPVSAGDAGRERDPPARRR